jgi:hypothetical protein
LSFDGTTRLAQSALQGSGAEIQANFAWHVD